MDNVVKCEDGCYGSYKGIALIGKVLAGHCKMRYTRVAVGKGKIPEDLSPKALEEAPEYVMDAMIASVTNPVHGECQVSIQINSSNVETGFYVTWLILYAEDPDEGEVPFTALCLESEPEWIRPASSIVGKLATFDIIAAVGDVDAVEAVIDPDAIATYAAVKQLIAEATAPSGTGAPTEDTPGVVGGRYFDAEAKQEYICVDVTPEGKAVWQASGGSSVFNTDITIPADGWAQTGTGRYPYSRDIPLDGVTARMVPSLTVLEEGEAAAIACGLAPRVQTIDGTVRVLAAFAPAADIPATLTLFCATSGAIAGGSSGGTGYSLPVATATRVGGVMIGAGSGLTVDSSGNVTLDSATEQDVTELFNDSDG